MNLIHSCVIFVVKSLLELDVTSTKNSNNHLPKIGHFSKCEFCKKHIYQQKCAIYLQNKMLLL